MKWSQEEIDRLAMVYEMDLPIDLVANDIGRTKKACINKAYQLGINNKLNPLTDEEKEYINKHYNGSNYNQIADKLNRHWSTILKSAKGMGLTKYGRMTEKRKKSLQMNGEKLKEFYKTEKGEKRKLEISEQWKEKWEEDGHPKGMLGKKHSEEHCEKQSKRFKEMWADPDAKVNSEEFKEKQAINTSRRQVKRLRQKGSNVFTRAKGGTREDLGFYVRSGWEANYARYLKFLKEKGQIHDFEFEPDTFYFHGIKRGTMSYTPDFKVWDTKDSYVFHEVKGYMDQKSKTKLSRMGKYYPDEKVIVIAKNEYKEIKDKLSRIIEHWED